MTSQHSIKFIINPETCSDSYYTTSTFKHIYKLSLAITKIIQKYDIQSITKAIFCLNAWRPNRSILSKTMALNLSLCTLRTTGNIHINTYQDFNLFYNEIHKFLFVDSMDDPIIDDFGEIFINYKGNRCPIITGTGHTQVYSALRYLVTLSDITNRSEELSIILQYLSTIINTLKETNLSSQAINSTFELPSQDFWNSINILFESTLFKEQLSILASILPTQNIPIEHKHFFYYNNQIFPLFNVSILVDYYKQLLTSSSTEDIDLHISKTIHTLLETTFNYSPNTPNKILINPRVYNMQSRQKIISEDLIFAGIHKHELLIAIKDNEKNIPKIIKTINSLKDNNLLTLVEPYYRDYVKGNLALNINTNFKITYMIIEYHTDISTDICRLVEANQEFNCTALDAIYLLGFASDLKEIIDFIDHYKNDNAKFFNFGGISSHFFVWKDAHRNISSGAIEFDQIFIDFSHSEVYTYNYFSDFLRIYPYNCTGLFKEPLCWNAVHISNDCINILHKGCLGFGGTITLISNDKYLFLSHNVEFYSRSDFDNITQTAITAIDDLNIKLFKKYARYLEEFRLLNGKTLQLMFIPYTYAQEKFSNTLLSIPDRSLVFSDAYITSDTIILRFSIHPETFLSHIKTASNCSVENLYFKELLAPLKLYEPKTYEVLTNKLLKDSNDKKSVDILETRLEYYFNVNTINTTISEKSYIKAQKEIAKICMASNITPGEYKGREATKIIRAIQEGAVNLFEEHISKIDKIHLHKRVLNYYALLEHNIHLNYLRHSTCSNLSYDIETENKLYTIQLREEQRRHSMTAQYLLESNLFIDHIHSEICDNETFEFLLAFSDCLVTLQYNADNCYYTEYDFVLNIDSEYKINFVINESTQNTYDMLMSRKYTMQPYHIKNDDADKLFLTNALEAFKNDTSVDITILFEVLTYLKLNVHYDNIANEIHPNVFEIDKMVLIQNLQQIFEEPKLNYSDLDKILNFITLDTSRLKSIDNKQCNVLPIWEREKRDNRASTKPLVLHKGKYIFSPVIVHFIYESWKNGILDWYIPYTIGLDNLCIALKDWKKRYENEMVADIQNLFKEAKFDIVLPNFELYKRFPKDNYPENLGDYDIFAISKSKKEIWLIESKVLQKVGSVYEDQMQQKGFFFQGKYDVKFQNRINYFIANISKILTSLNLPIEDYKIIPFMVTNKLFASRYKKINFPIITFSELKDKLLFDLN